MGKIGLYRITVKHSREWTVNKSLYVIRYGDIDNSWTIDRRRDCIMLRRCFTISYRHDKYDCLCTIFYQQKQNTLDGLYTMKDVVIYLCQCDRCFNGYLIFQRSWTRNTVVCNTKYSAKWCIEDPLQWWYLTGGENVQTYSPQYVKCLSSTVFFSLATQHNITCGYMGCHCDEKIWTTVDAVLSTLHAPLNLGNIKVFFFYFR